MGRKEENLNTIFNASNMLGATAFFAMILVAAAYEGGSYIMAVAFLAIFARCAYLSLKEDGQIR